MLAWLGEWLRSIVVVVLLAIVIELVLPSSKMLRYSRLVVGLVLLLTMLNPLLQLFQIDFQEKLNASFQQWERETKSKHNSVSSLQKITGDAEMLKQKREGAALDVTRASLEQAMLQQLTTASTAQVANVSVQLGWSAGANKQQLPYIEIVTVKLAPPHEEYSTDELAAIAPVEIDEISIPDIQVGDEEQYTDVNEQAEAKGQHSKTDEQWDEQFIKQAQEIVSIIASGWNVEANHIFVEKF